MTWFIRRAQAGDGGKLQAVRLAALREYPKAFAETAAHAEALHLTDWETRVARSSVPGRQILAVATDRHDDFVAMMGCLIDSERDRSELEVAVPEGARWAMLWGAYASPRVRGRGLADQLLATIHRWAAEEAFVDWISLNVVETNTRATRFYRRNGYTATALRRPHANDAMLTEIVMVRPLRTDPEDAFSRIQR